MKKFSLLAMLLFMFGAMGIAQITVFPFDEGFESPTAPPTGWTMEYADPNPASSNLMIHDSYSRTGSQSFGFSSYANAYPPDYS